MEWEIDSDQRSENNQPQPTPQQSTPPEPAPVVAEPVQKELNYKLPIKTKIAAWIIITIGIIGIIAYFSVGVTFIWTLPSLIYFLTVFLILKRKKILWIVSVILLSVISIFLSMIYFIIGLEGADLAIIPLLITPMGFFVALVLLILDYKNIFRPTDTISQYKLKELFLSYNFLDIKNLAKTGLMFSCINGGILVLYIFIRINFINSPFDKHVEFFILSGLVPVVIGLLGIVSCIISTVYSILKKQKIEKKTFLGILIGCISVYFTFGVMVSFSH